jgi:hypothetical protein
LIIAYRPTETDAADHTTLQRSAEICDRTLASEAVDAPTMIPAAIGGQDAIEKPWGNFPPGFVSAVH